MLQIKRVYDPRDDSDGLRVLVDRLWPRGLTKQAAAIDLWLKEIAPSDGLRRWFHNDKQDWTEFRRRYLAELRQNDNAVAEVRNLAAAGKVSLLYGAKDEEHNHAVVLLEFLCAEPELVAGHTG
jgi:uncharacterized protein YeaO (DUF488 family)